MAKKMKAAPKKGPAKKTAAKKAAPKKAAIKKAAPKKATPKKVAPPKKAEKKTTMKKSPAKKTAAKKSSSKNVTSKKTAPKKIASKRAATKKTGKPKMAAVPKTKSIPGKAEAVIPAPVMEPSELSEVANVDNGFESVVDINQKTTETNVSLPGQDGNNPGSAPIPAEMQPGSANPYQQSAPLPRGKQSHVPVGKKNTMLK